MTLATRISAFFLATLAAVLVGFSAGVYAFQRWVALRETDERLSSALRTLVASIEVEPDGVEWNPREHRLVAPAVPTTVEWRVTDDAGNVIDETPGFGPIRAEESTPADDPATVEATPDGFWRVARDRVSVAEAKETSAASPAPDPEPDDTPEYPALVVTAAVPLSAVRSGLNRLALALALLSTTVWATVAVFGRAMVRRALRPVSRMAAAARVIDAGSDARLPVADAGDELTDLGLAFNGLLDRLAEALGRERRFTAEASHQLRTPVTALLGHVDVTLRRDRPPEEYRETLREVRTQADRLRRIVESLLTLARADAPSPPPEPLEIATWLPAYIKTWAAHPRAADLRSEIDLPPGRTLPADPSLLGQLLEILIDNAFKHGPPHRPVTVRATEPEAGVAIDVTDAGTGLSPAEAADLFRPFQRGAEATRRGTPGLGLGLALARRIAARLGASLTFERPAAGGCRFRALWNAPNNPDRPPSPSSRRPSEPE